MKILPRSPHAGYLDTHFWVPRSYINVDAVKAALSFSFSDPRSKSVRYVYLWKDAPHHLLVPRHLWKFEGLTFPVIDCRPREYERTAVTSRVKLDHRFVDLNDGQGKRLLPTGKDTQQRSMHALHTNPSGILQLACGAGKSVIALEFIKQLGGPGIIIVDNTQLLEQWKGEIEDLLDCPDGVGLVQADVFDWQKPVVLATYQTLANLASSAPEEFRRWFSVAIWDEGHHISAPTFASSAEMFYGFRLALTATPYRTDGTHIIYEMHVGSVIYKNLTQDLNARVAFCQTGIAPEETRPDCKIRDVAGELHLSMLGVYCGRWREHLNVVLSSVHEAVQHKRRVLVLCSSIDEAVNLCAIWNGMPDLYTDIPIPTPQDVGETLEPMALTKEQQERYAKHLEELGPQIARAQAKVTKLWENQGESEHYVKAAQRLGDLQGQQQKLTQCLAQHEVYRKVNKITNKRQKDYLARLNEHIKTGGLMIYKVDPEIRKRHLDTKQVVFCFKKYGREGLNNPALDTVITTLPFSSAQTLQQVKGRVERLYPGKQEPLVIIYEHNVGPLIGMCQKLRGHLREWPIEDGGPFTYETHNYVQGNTCRTPLF
jgi:superfamily II DNA or RNA helicase